MPLRRRHAVEGDRARITKAIAPKLLDLPQFDYLVSLGGTQQEVAVVMRYVIIGHCHLPNGRSHYIIISRVGWDIIRSLRAHN